MFTVLPLLPIISLACSCFTQVFKWYFPLRFLGLGFDNKSVSLTWWLFMPFCLMNTLINVLLVTYLCSLCWIYLMTLFLNNPDRFSILCTSRKLGFLKSQVNANRPQRLKRVYNPCHWPTSTTFRIRYTQRSRTRHLNDAKLHTELYQLIFQRIPIRSVEALTENLTFKLQWLVNNKSHENGFLP